MLGWRPFTQTVSGLQWSGTSLFLPPPTLHTTCPCTQRSLNLTKPQTYQHFLNPFARRSSRRSWRTYEMSSGTWRCQALVPLPCLRQRCNRVSTSTLCVCTYKYRTIYTYKQMYIHIYIYMLPPLPPKDPPNQHLGCPLGSPGLPESSKSFWNHF